VSLVGFRKSQTSRLRTRWLAVTTALAAVAAVALIYGCSPDSATLPVTSGGQPPGFFPVEPITQQGGAIAAVYPIVFYIAVAVFILVEGLLLWIVFRYRRRPAQAAELPPQTHGHNLLEVLWTAIPALIVTGLFIGTVNTLAHVENLPEDEPEVVVDVTGFQWQWRFDYPNEDPPLSFLGSGTQGPTMVVPVDERIRIRLHAQDVIHSFYVPQFLYKKDVIPGRVNEFEVVVETPGIYSGQCAEFCGLGHADMFFSVEAVSRADYEAWVTEQQTAEPTPEPPPDGHTIEVTAVDVFTFDPPALTAPADTPIIFEFHNADAPAVPHDVSIEAANPDGTDWIGLPPAQGGEDAVYVAPALPAGSYEFYCSIHPTTMRGTLSVGP